jgi:hypothetical protein
LAVTAFGFEGIWHGSDQLTHYELMAF